MYGGVEKWEETNMTGEERKGFSQCGKTAGGDTRVSDSESSAAVFGAVIILVMLATDCGQVQMWV